MKANSKNAVKARTSAKANATTPNSTTNLAQKSAKIISAEQKYLQLYMLKCFVELDCFSHFITKCSYNYDEIAKFLGFYHLCDSKETYQADRKLIKAKVFDFCKMPFTSCKSVKNNAEDFYKRLCEKVRVKDLKRENAKAGFC